MDGGKIRYGDDAFRGDRNRVLRLLLPPTDIFHASRLSLTVLSNRLPLSLLDADRPRWGQQG